MNHILYNISLIILFLGIILLTIYITKASSNNYLTLEKQLLIKENNIRRNNSIKNVNIYDYRPSDSFKKMFAQPSVWMSYQDFDPKDETEKIFIKS